MLRISRVCRPKVHGPSTARQKCSALAGGLLLGLAVHAPLYGQETEEPTIEIIAQKKLRPPARSLGSKTLRIAFPGNEKIGALFLNELSANGYRISPASGSPADINLSCSIVVEVKGVDSKDLRGDLQELMNTKALRAIDAPGDANTPRVIMVAVYAPDAIGWIRKAIGAGVPADSSTDQNTCVLDDCRKIEQQITAGCSGDLEWSSTYRSHDRKAVLPRVADRATREMFIPLSTLKIR